MITLLYRASENVKLRSGRYVRALWRLLDVADLFSHPEAAACVRPRPSDIPSSSYLSVSRLIGKKRDFEWNIGLCPAMASRST